jgi:hypothetical protein
LVRAPPWRWRFPIVLAAIIAISSALVLLASAHRRGFSGPLGAASVATASPMQAQIAVSTSGQGAYFAKGSVALSTEAFELGQKDLTGAHGSMVRLLRRLGPGVLRIGGDTADKAWWTSHSEPTPAWAIVRVTPTDLVLLRSLMAKTGWRAVLAVDFGHLDAARAADEARAAAHILGSRLAGIEIGNEPNDYNLGAIDLRPGYYTWPEYFSQISSYVQSIRAAVPSVPLYGPDTSSPVWFAYIASQHQPFDVYTEHYYPTSFSSASGACPATPVPTARDLLAPSIWSAETQLVHELITAADVVGKPAVIDETNSTASCDDAGGPDTSPVFASAVWAMDWSLRAASGGIAAIFFHSEFGQCGKFAGTPICAESGNAEARGDVSARPEYFGLLAAASLEGGRFIPVTVSSASGTSSVSAYATVTPAGVVKLAIINANFDRCLRVSVATGGPVRVKVAYLTAPHVLSSDDVSFGALVGRSGTIYARKSENDTRADGEVTLRLRPVRAVVVTFRPGQTA